jgi:diguanylate cyclase (GGDEF)-like protein
MAVLAVVAALAGLVGVQVLQADIETRTINSAVFSARLISSLVVTRNIVAADVAGGPLAARSRDDMDHDVEELTTHRQLEGLEVWTLRDGALVYADRAHPRSERVLPGAELTRARLGMFSSVSTTGRRRPTFDVFLPFDATGDGVPDAVVEVLLPTDPINDEIARSTTLLYVGATVAALLGTVVLWRVRRRQKRQEYAARHDELTGLGNWAHLAERIEQDAGTVASALLLLDLDGFREINDTLGHSAGDELLVAVAGRLRAATRDKDTIVRLGGDEFAILLHDLAWPGKAEVTAQRLRQALRDPITVGGLVVETDASIGIAYAPLHDTNVNALLRCAEVAMYDAKSNDRSITAYDPATDNHDESRLTILAELRHAITAGQLRLYYQPKCRPDGTVDCVEALVRWQHPERGLLAPIAFLPLAERTSLIKPLTTWVIEEAARQGAAWHASGYPLGIAVNISPRNLGQDDLPAIVLDAITAAGLPRGALGIEVTETAVMADPDQAHAALHHLRAMGVNVSIDDFGTGYTSLSQLATLPVDILKIDRLFVADLMTNPVHRAVVRNVVQLARDLGLTTVAEGVESRDIWAELNRVGCDEIQGYLLTPPLPPDRLIAWLAEWTATPARPGHGMEDDADPAPAGLHSAR